MSKKTTRPLKVTCKLYDGRINSMDGLIYFDSILYHAWFCKYAPEVIRGEAKYEGPKQHFGLPLTMYKDMRYAASLGFYKQYEQHIEYWNKRPDFTNGKNSRYLNAKGKVDVGAGKLKAYHFPNVIRTVSDIEFYCCGTPEKIVDLLSYIPAVGKKPAAGWGKVKEWIVEPIEEDYSTFGPYGLMRPMPVDEIIVDQPYMIMQCAIHPPSWKACNQTLCYVPKVILNAR